MFTNTVYKHVMFTKQKYNKCLQNKRLQTRYVYKTKIYRQVMFTKQTQIYKHVMFTKQNRKFTNTLCLQNKIKPIFTKQKFKNRLCL